MISGGNPMPGTQSCKQTPDWDECVQILERLPSLSFESRVEAVECLVRNPSPGIREQALRIGAAILPDSRLTEYLRDDSDAVLRSAGSEIFRLRGGSSLPAVIGLLRDPDPDVVLQAVLILGRLGDPRALEPLHAALAHADPNIQQEALLAVGRLGDARSIPHLLPFLDADAWVQMAAVQALGDLRTVEAIPHLAARLTDPVVGSLAAEALARIGGEPAFQKLAAHWLSGGAEEEETLLGLLAHVLEGLHEPPATLPEGFAAAVAARLEQTAAGLSEAAARCLLVLGPGEWEGQALAALTASAPPMGTLPAALSRRGDLAGRLLALPGEARFWGLLLAARFPRQVPAPVFLAAVGELGEDAELLPPLVRALESVRLAGLGEALLDLYLRLGVDGRELLVSPLQIHAADVRAALDRRPEVSPGDRLVLSALLGRPADEVVGEVAVLPPARRPDVIGPLMGMEPLVRRLPWTAWLEESPEHFGALAAEAAGRYELRHLLPLLRGRAAAAPSATAVRVLGELADREAVPLLRDLLEGEEDLRAVILESLGRIGGDEARRVLCEVVQRAPAGPEARIAYRALAACAGAGDEALLRQAAHHPDWYVRLAVVDALARFNHPEDVALLARLAADPVSAVAHRALALLAN
jgi:HEAT repeat protein